MQTFQDVMCKPSAQPRYVAMFTVLHFLHLCLSDSVRVKSLQASVLRRNAAARVRHSYCFSLSSDHVSALLVMLESICKHFFWLPPKRDSSVLHLNISNAFYIFFFCGFWFLLRIPAEMQRLPANAIEDLHNYARVCFCFSRMTHIIAHRS